MRRNVGIAGLQKQQKTKQQFKEVGDAMEVERVSQMKDQLGLFKENLEEFAKKYRKEIAKNPEFRAQFQKMCGQIGVDPLASNKGFWSEMLGVGDFYYELGVQIIDVCMATRSQNGGLIEVNELKRRLEKKRGKKAQEISMAIKKLKTLGGGFDLVSVGAQKLVQSVPLEMNMEYTTVLAMAQEKGFTSLSDIVAETKWDRDRAQRQLDTIVKEGVAWIDTQAPETLYWIPSFFAEGFE